MTTVVLQCDICKRKREDFPADRWEHQFHPGEVTIKEDGFNGDTLKWEHLCYPCRKELLDGIRLLVERMRRE